MPAAVRCKKSPLIRLVLADEMTGPIVNRAQRTKRLCARRKVVSVSQDRQFDIGVNLRLLDEDTRSIPATLNRVANGMFVVCSPTFVSPGDRLEMRAQERSLQSRVIFCERQPEGNFRLGLVIESDDRRRLEARIEFQSAGVLRILNSFRTLAVTVIDISPSGLGLELPTLIPVGAAVRVEFSAGIGTGEIRHCARRGDRYRAGMRMHEFILDPNTRNMIASNEARSAPETPIAAFVRSIQERQLRYEAILYSLAPTQRESTPAKA